MSTSPSLSGPKAQPQPQPQPKADRPLVEKKIKKPRTNFGNFFPYLHLSIAAILTIFLLGGAFFAKSKLDTFAGEAEAARGQVIALRDREISFQRLAQDLDKVAPQIETIKKSLPDEKGIVRFVREFKGISEEVAVSVFKFETDSPALDEEGNAFIDFQVELIGSFPALESFLTKLIKLPYLIRLRVVDIEGKGEESKMIIGARIFVDQPFFKNGENL